MPVPRVETIASKVAVVALAAMVAGNLAGCAGDGGDDTGSARADQAVDAARQAGLGDEVAELLGLAARGATATYTVTYATDSGSEIVIHQDGADRRIDVRNGDETSVRLVRDGQAFACTLDGSASDDASLDACTKTDALVDPPGTFDQRAVDQLIDALQRGRDDFDIDVTDEEVASTAASCLRTSRKPDRDDPLLARAAVFCVSPQGAPLLVEQGDERLQAVSYAANVDRQVFELPSSG